MTKTLTIQTDLEVRRDEMVSKITTDVLQIETLVERKIDSLDFHDLDIISIKRALEAAFMAGYAAARLSNKARG